MPSPPIDEFRDDPSIKGNRGLIRRISPRWTKWNEPRENGEPGISSMAFQRQKLDVALKYGYPDRCISFGLSDEIMLQKEGLHALLLGVWASYGLAVVTAGDVRECRFDIHRAPEPDIGEPWHVVAFLTGTRKDEEKAKGTLAARAAWLVLPTQEV